MVLIAEPTSSIKLVRESALAISRVASVGNHGVTVRKLLPNPTMYLDIQLSLSLRRDSHREYQNDDRHISKDSERAQ